MESLVPWLDHYYLNMTPTDATPLYPGEVLKPTGPQSDSAIVVCANGGGIQAAAWTAKVLTELERTFPAEILAVRPSD